VHTRDWLEVGAALLPLVILAPPLGFYMYRIWEQPQRLPWPVQAVESLFFRVIGADPAHEMTWREYTCCLLLFNAFGFLAVFALQMSQAALPLNPERLPGVTWHLAVNTAISFMTNTNWQAYAGEVTLSYFVQLLGLAVQNFVSAATGLAVALALVRGLIRAETKVLGNFWADLIRGVVFILLPLSIIVATVLISQGVVQTLSGHVSAVTMEGSQQNIPLGPAASQVAIKQLGTNGGGFFGANSAHPLENPTPLSNWLEMLSLLLIPAAMVFTFGHMVKSRKQAWTLYLVMFGFLCLSLAVGLWAEHSGVPALGGPTMEGKETRFGITGSVLWSVFTTAASNGSVNAMHSSFTPLGGAVPLVNMLLGEVIFGGVGAGLYGMLLFVLLTVFLAGLMVGRTPEYLGKKLDGRDMRLALLAIILPNLAILLGTGLSVVLPAGLAGLASGGPHGFSEIFYAFTSAGANNGSAFAGLAANSPYYNLMLGLVMLIGRFGIIVPVLAIAGNLAEKKKSPASAGTFATDNVLFALLLTGVILIIGGLTYLPALALGPIAEHLLMLRGLTF
jgi:K+-transporting ATPase ATPase A chain